MAWDARRRDETTAENRAGAGWTVQAGQRVAGKQTLTERLPPPPPGPVTPTAVAPAAPGTTTDPAVPETEGPGARPSGTEPIPPASSRNSLYALFGRRGDSTANLDPAAAETHGIAVPPDTTSPAGDGPIAPHQGAAHAVIPHQAARRAEPDRTAPHEARAHDVALHEVSGPTAAHSAAAHDVAPQEGHAEPGPTAPHDAAGHDAAAHMAAPRKAHAPTAPGASGPPPPPREESPHGIRERAAQDMAGQDAHGRTAPPEAGMYAPAPHEAAPEAHGATVPHDGSPGEMLTSLTQAPATKLSSHLSTVKAASPHAFDKQRKDAQYGLPKVPAPTGLPPKAAEGKKVPDRPAPGRAQEAAAPAGGKPPPKGYDEVPEAPPAQPTPTHLAGGGTPPAATAEGDTPRDPAMEKSAQAAVEQVSLPSDQVPTSAGEPPQVDLTGGADPAQMQSTEHTADADVATHHQHALAEVGIERGEKDIAPRPDHDVLHADLPVGSGGATGGGRAAHGHAALPPEALASIDAHASPLLHEKIGAEKEKYTSADAEYHAGSEKAKADATTKTAELETEAKASQSEARGTAQAEVAGARTDWQGEIDGVHKKFKTDATAASSEHGGQIRGHAETGNREATQHMRKAEADAATERQKAEGEAEKKKGEARKESSGFWGWVKDKAKALVDGLKAAVNFIYDNLRRAVKTLFEAAKKLAMAAIEMARRAIVGLIKAFAAVLKTLVFVAVAAFPELRDKMLKRIDAAVNRAVDLVNKAAAGLKKAVAAVLDFLAKTIDSLLKLVQNIYNGILTVVGMIVSGEFAELLQKLANLVAAAKTAPGQFETAAYEQLLGGDLDEPLSPGELIAAGRTPPGMAAGPGGAEPIGGIEHHEGEGAEGEGPHPPWTEENVGVENVASGVQLSPELEEEFAARTGDNGAVEFGNSESADRNMENILGLQPGQAAGQQGEGPAQQGSHAVDGLTPRERAEVKWTLMKQGLAKWWSDNWPYVIGGGVLAVAGFIVANIFTGGAILAALPTIMTVVGYLFTGMLVVQLVGYVRDFLQKGWAGDARGGGKALASALAAGAIELISWLTFKAGSAALKGAKAAAKGVAKGAQAAARVGARAARGAVNLVKRGVNYLIKGSKVFLRGAGDAIGRAVKSLREMGERLLARTKFKGFRFRIEGRRWELEGRINPWVLLATGKVEYVKGREGGLGSRTTVHGAEGAQDAIVIGQKSDVALKNLFEGMSQGDAQAAYKLLNRADLRPDEILSTLKAMDPKAAEKVLQDLRQFKHVDEAELRKIMDDYRRETGISKGRNADGEITGGTVAAGKAEVPTHNIDATHRGASAEAQTSPKHFDDTLQSPQADARARNHAEQTVLGQSAKEIEAAVEQRVRAALGSEAHDLEALAAARKVAEEQLQGTLKIVVDQAVCSACRQGLDSSVAAGIIKQFSDRFKNMTIYLIADGTSEILIVQGGKILR